MKKEENDFCEMEVINLEKDFKRNHPIYIPEKVNKYEKKNPNDWPGLGDDSYIFDSLKKHGNTILSYNHCLILAKHVWHIKFSKHTPTDFATNPKYKDKYLECLKEIENYISKKAGKCIRMRYAKVDKVELSSIHGGGFSEDSAVNDDFWVLEIKGKKANFALSNSLSKM